MYADVVGSGQSGHLNPTSNIKQVPAGKTNANGNPPPGLTYPQVIDTGMSADRVAPPIGSKIIPQQLPSGFAIAHGGNGSAPVMFSVKGVPPTSYDGNGPMDPKLRQPNGPFLVGKKMIAPNKLPFPPPIANVKGGNAILQQLAFPPSIPPNKSMGNQKVMMRPPVISDGRVKSPPGVLQPSSSLPQQNPLGVAMSSGKGSNSTIGPDPRNINSNEGNNQMRPPSQNLGILHPQTSRSSLSDGSNKVAHLISSSRVPSETSIHTPSPKPPLSAKNIVYTALGATDKPVMPISGSKNMSPEGNSMQNIAPLGQSGGTQPSNPNIPNRTQGEPGSMSVNPGLLPSTNVSGVKNSTGIPSQTQASQKGSLDQLLAEVKADPIADSKPTDSMQAPTSTTLKQGPVESNLMKAETLSKPPRLSYKKKPCRFAELLVDSDDDSDEDGAIEENNAHARGDSTGAAHSDEAAPPNPVLEDALTTVAKEFPQTGDVIGANEAHDEISMKAETVEGKDEMPYTGNDDTQVTESAIPLEPKELPVLPVQDPGEPKNFCPEHPPSISSTNRPSPVSNSQSNSMASERIRPDSADSRECTLKAGKANSSKASRSSSAPKPKVAVQAVSKKSNKDIALPRTKNPSGRHSQTKLTTHHRSFSSLPDMSRSEDTPEERKKGTIATESSQSIGHTPKQIKPTKNTATLSERSDDLAADELVSSTTYPSDEDAKERAPRRKRVPSLSNFKSSDLYNLYHILKALDDKKNADRPSRDRVQRRGPTPPHPISKPRGFTPTHHRHRGSHGESEDEGGENWGQRGETPHFRWSEPDNPSKRQETPERGDSARAPWRCGARSTVSNGFALPSPLRRPLGYINIGGGFYERIGYSPYAQHRLRHSLSRDDPSIYPDRHLDSTTREVLKDGGIGQIMREQGQAAVRAAQSDPLHQNPSSKRMGVDAGNISRVCFSDLSPQQRWSMDSSRFYSPDAEPRGDFLYVGENPPQGNGDSSNHYCASPRRTRLLISPNYLDDDRRGSPPAKSSQHVKQVAKKSIAPDLIKDGGKAFDMFLRRASKPQSGSSRTDLNWCEGRASDSGKNVCNGEKAHLQSAEYKKHLSTLPEGSKKKSFHPYEGDRPDDRRMNRFAQHRRSTDGDNYMSINSAQQTWDGEGRGVSLKKTSADDRSHHLPNPVSDRRKEPRNRDSRMSPRSSRSHLGKVHSTANVDTSSQPKNKEAHVEYNVNHYDRNNNITKNPKNIETTTRQDSSHEKRLFASLPSSGRSQKVHENAAGSFLGQRSTTEAIDSLISPIEITKARIVSPRGSMAFSGRNLAEQSHQGSSKAILKKNSLPSTAPTAVELRVKGISAPNKRATSASSAQTTPMATANLPHSLFSNVESRTTRRKSNFGHTKAILCSEWVDEVLSSVVHLKGFTSAEVSKADTSIGKISSARAVPHGEIPLIDMRKEFKPITSEDLAKSTPTRRGRLSARSRNSLNSGGGWSVNDRALRPHIPTLHFKTMTGVRLARGVPNPAGPPPSQRENATSARGGNARPTPEKVRQVVVDVPNGMPYEVYSSIKVKNPEQPSPWARAPSVRGRMGELPGRPAARRVVPPSATTDIESSETKEGNVAPALEKAGYRLIEELHLDEYRRPYIIIKEVRTGEAAKEQRLSVERLSKPKPVFIRPAERQK
ncbi:unnamed protein product [Phytomonas sp. Hart1]|nr:unnamed protein product [Phytomonas sp. Hart1]|eukprot:CCW69079.1 unnamed protein product [Phytomonas sp. isolate Hart1]